MTPEEKCTSSAPPWINVADAGLPVEPTRESTPGEDVEKLTRFFRLNDIVREVYAEQQREINQRISERIADEFGDAVEVQKLNLDPPYAGFRGPATGVNAGKTRMRMVVSLVDLIFDKEKR